MQLKEFRNQSEAYFQPFEKKQQKDI